MANHAQKKLFHLNLNTQAKKFDILGTQKPKEFCTQSIHYKPMVASAINGTHNFQFQVKYQNF